MKTTLSIWALAAALAGSLAAQEPAAPSRGATVRLHLRRSLGISMITGALLEVTADSVVIAPSGFFHRVGYPHSDLAALDVRTRVRATAKFLLVGGVAGGVLGAAAAGFAGGDDDGTLTFLADAGRTVLGAAAGTLVGVLVGAVTAARLGEERWVRVDLDQLRIDVSALPQGRLGLGATFHF